MEDALRFAENFMNPSVLSMPVGAILRPASPVFVEDSLGVAAQRLRDSGSPMIPVMDGDGLAGAVTEASLARAVAAGFQSGDVLTPAKIPAPTIAPNATGSEALRLFDSFQADSLIVVDARGNVRGLVLPSDLLQTRDLDLRPPLIGGMATPFGVYLTTGGLGAGASNFALVTTGMTMSAMWLAGSLAAVYLHFFLQGRHVSPWLIDTSAGALNLIVFLALMRFLPLSGIHAAEHKVVHAIERGEELTKDAVRRMPRVHPRCGTNLAVGAALFGSVFDWLAQFRAVGSELALIAAAIVTLVLWRRLGNLTQYWITTRPPTEKQLDMGIRSGKKLLDAYQRSDMATPTVGQRIYYSGIAYVIAGAFLCIGCAYVAAVLFGVQDVLFG